MSGSAGGSGRAVSTVVDVTLALLFISAAVVLVATHLDSQPGEHESQAARETAATLASTTGMVEYSIDPITSDPDYPGGGPFQFGSPDFTRDTYGTPVELVAEAAVTNTTIDGRRLTRTAEKFTPAVDGMLRNRLTESGATNTQIEAIWRPYEGSSIVGTVTVGRAPPGDADVSVAVLNVSSGIPSVDSGAVEAGFRNGGFEGAAEPIADAVVRGWFPLDSTQTALEKQGLPRAVALYRYQRFQTVLNGTGNRVSYGITGLSLGGLGPTYLDSVYADAGAANDRVAGNLTQYVADDLRSVVPGSATAESIGRRVSTGSVRVVVKTWSN